MEEKRVMAMMTRNDLMRLVCLTIGVEILNENVTLFILCCKENKRGSKRARASVVRLLDNFKHFTIDVGKQFNSAWAEEIIGRKMFLCGKRASVQ